MIIKIITYSNVVVFNYHIYHIHAKRLTFVYALLTGFNNDDNDENSITIIIYFSSSSSFKMEIVVNELFF
jgi:hypothetical protein